MPANYEALNVSAEQSLFLAIPGFDKLSPDRQAIFYKVPPDKFNLVRPAIEKEISELGETLEETDLGEAEKSEGKTEETVANNREVQSETAIDTFHRAENGDPEAKKDLLDQKKELLKEEPTDDEIFQTILETQSSNPFAQDTTLEVMLSDNEAQAHQDVLNLFKEFRGDLPSVDDALKPKQQIDLFLELTKGGGNLANRTFFVRQALTILTANGQRNLRTGLQEIGVLDGSNISESGVTNLKKLTNRNQGIPSHS